MNRPEQLRKRLEREPVEHHDDDSMVVAGLCFAGALAVMLVGACVIAAAALVSWLT